jgi:hypothetical protein
MSKHTHYVIKNWPKYQHYKTRNPPWVKLYCEILTSEDWVMLDDASRVLAIACMLMASKDDNGYIPDNPGYVQRVCYLNSKPDFAPLLESGFLQVVDIIEPRASKKTNPLADASMNQKDARPETETETETETDSGCQSASAAAPDTVPSKPDKPKKNPIEQYEKINAQYPRIWMRIKEAHPKAKIPQDGSATDYKARQTLDQLIRLDGFTEDEILLTLRWLFLDEPQDADFSWRNNVHGIAKLRDMKDGDSINKFGKIHEAYRRHKLEQKRKAETEDDDPWHIRQARAEGRIS